MGKCPVCKLVGLLLVIGALNWGSIGVFNVNFVNSLLGASPAAEKVIYILVGLAGLLGVVMCAKKCPCNKGECGTPK